MLEIIIVAIILSTIINLFFWRYHIPTIIWYISTWLILTFIFWLNDSINSEKISNVAEFGIVFLMFTIWLEFSLEKLFKLKYKVFVMWWLQFFITGLLIYTISNFIVWIPVKTSIIIACWLTLSSTAILLKTLNENKEIKKKYGQRALWILLFQDLAVIPILLLISIFASSDSSFALLSLQIIWWGLILIWLLFWIWKFLFAPFFDKVYKIKSNEVFIWAIFSILLWASYLAHYLWFSYSLWALIAWVLVAETNYKHQVEADLLPFRDLLLWVFFMTVWMQLDTIFIIQNFIVISFILFWLIFIKIWIIYLISIQRATERISIKAGLALFQVWEFWIVVFELASKNNLLTDNITQILITVTVLSMILTPFVLKNIEFLADFLTNNKKYNIDDDKNPSWEDKVVLIWYWRLWRVISDILDDKWVNHMIIEKYPKFAEIWLKQWKNIILWNAWNKHLLKSLNVWRAKSVIVSVWDNQWLYKVCKCISEQLKKWKIIVKVNNYGEKKMLKKLNLSHIVVETEATAFGMVGELWK